MRTGFRLSLGQAVFFGSIFLALIPLLIVAFFSYHNSKQSLTKHATNALISSIEYEQKIISDYVSEIRKDLEAQSELLPNIRFMKKLNSSYVTGGKELGNFIDSFEWAAMSMEDGSGLHTFQLTYGYYDVFLVGVDGDVIFTVKGEDDLGTNLLTGKFAESGLNMAFRRALETGGMAFSDLVPYGPSDDLPFLFLANILEDDETGETIGVIVFQLPLAKITTMMKRYIGLGETGETYLVGHDSFMRSEARHTKVSTMLNTRVSTIPVVAWREQARHDPANEGEPGISRKKQAKVMTYVDYRGVDVLGIVRNLEFLEELGLDWALVAKIDQAEAFSSIHQLQKIFLGLLSLTIVAIFLLSWFLSRHIASPFQALTEWSGRIASGDLSDQEIAAPFTEIDLLNRSFGKAVVSLRNGERDLQSSHDKLEELADSLENQVKERTQELVAVNEEMKNFVYIVSHDLRSPLINFKGFVGEISQSIDMVKPVVKPLLSDMDDGQRRIVETAFDEDIPEAVEFLDKSVKKMDGLIKAVLKLSRIGWRDLAFEELDMTALAREAVDTMAHQIQKVGATVEIQVLPSAVADPLSMEQMFDNLISNAVKYLAPERPGNIVVSGEKADGKLVYHVRDNGCGIAKEDISKAFELFRRLGRQEEPGEGMGLAYLKVLIRRHGGHIWCDSRLGEGSTFSFNLPLHKPARRDEE